MWSISVNEVLYRMHPFFSSYPPGRMTRVGIAYPTEGGKPSDLAYIKISHVDQCREEGLYLQAHSKGNIPGLVRLVGCESRPSLVKGEHGPKQKEVVVLGSGGEPLSRCGSVSELLKVIYDAIESRSCVCLFSAAYLIGSPAGNGRSGRFASRCQSREHLMQTQTLLS